MAKKKSKTSKIKRIPAPPHAWRLCPLGEHWVRTHPLHIPPSKKDPDGSITSRRGHCATNPSGKDQIYPDEILEISEIHFPTIKNMPCPLELEFKKKGSQYDNLIAGWTQYWNEVLKPDVPLDVNLVKALIASESMFNKDALANKKDPDIARGLMQITNATRKILGDEKGEVKEHFLTLTKKDLHDPSINICAGIRWLFYKRDFASHVMKKKASWHDAVAEYKGTRKAPKERASELMSRFDKFLTRYQKCGK